MEGLLLCSSQRVLQSPSCSSIASFTYVNIPKPSPINILNKLAFHLLNSNWKRKFLYPQLVGYRTSLNKGVATKFFLNLLHSTQVFLLLWRFHLEYIFCPRKNSNIFQIRSKTFWQMMEVYWNDLAFTDFWWATSILYIYTWPKGKWSGFTDL